MTRLYPDSRLQPCHLIHIALLASSAGSRAPVAQALGSQILAKEIKSLRKHLEDGKGVQQSDKAAIEAAHAETAALRDDVEARGAAQQATDQVLHANAAGSKNITSLASSMERWLMFLRAERLHQRRLQGDHSADLVWQTASSSDQDSANLRHCCI